MNKKWLTLSSIVFILICILIFFYSKEDDIVSKPVGISEGLSDIPLPDSGYIIEPSTLRYISLPGCYGDITIHGSGDLTEDGIVIQVQGDIYIENVAIDNVRIPLTFKGYGDVDIQQVYAKNYFGDGLNIKQSNVSIHKLTLVNPVSKIDPKLYHQDLILQAYAVTSNGYTINTKGIIENIYLPDITLIGGLPNKDLITLSEFNAYRSFYIGAEEATFRV